MDTTYTWSVDELTAWLAAAVEAAVPDEVWVEGEICNLSRSSKGHVYFSLIGPGNDRRSPDAAVAVTLFDWYRQKVNHHLRRSGGAVRMEDGVRVRIRGRVELYRPKGQISLRMVAIDASFTLGTLAADRDRLLRELSAAGLLGANGRRSVPALPLEIGLVTSIGSAAHADFIHELEGSRFGFSVTAVDARVQGTDAEASVTAALASLEQVGVDVIAVVRGGGARTDLAAFDSEGIARAIARCQVPVWVGIGHETDRTVADEVAHSSFKTPTACAVAITEAVRRGAERTEVLWGSITAVAEARLIAATTDLDRVTRAAAHATSSTVTHAEQRLGETGRRTARASARVLTDAERRLTDSASMVVRRSPRLLDAADRTLAALDSQARAHDPALTLRRGWSITRRDDGTIVRSVEGLAPGALLHTRFGDGTVRSTVLDVSGESTPEDGSHAT